MWMRRNKIVDLFYILSSQELFDGRPAHDLAGVDEHRLSVGKKHKLRIALTHIDKRSLQIAKPCSFRLTALLGLSRFIRSLVIGLRFRIRRLRRRLALPVRIAARSIAARTRRDRARKRADKHEAQEHTGNGREHLADNGRLTHTPFNKPVVGRFSDKRPPYVAGQKPKPDAGGDASRISKRDHGKAQHAEDANEPDAPALLPTGRPILCRNASIRYQSILSKGYHWAPNTKLRLGKLVGAVGLEPTILSAAAFKAAAYANSATPP